MVCLHIIHFKVYSALKAYIEPEASTSMALVSVELRSSMEYDVELSVAGE